MEQEVRTGQHPSPEHPMGSPGGGNPRRDHACQLKGMLFFTMGSMAP